MTVYTRKRPSYKTALELARQLSMRDQRRLRAELAKLSGVTLVHPSQDAKKVRSARVGEQGPKDGAICRGEAHVG